MSSLLIWLAIFVISLIVLIKSADFFTTSAEKTGKLLCMPNVIIGATVVAIGTSLPELASSVMAVLKGSSEIVSGNVVGSNITNIFLVFGLAALIGSKIIVNRDDINVDLFFLVASAFLLAFFAYDGKFVAREAMLCLVIMAMYIIYAVRKSSDDNTSNNNMPSKDKLSFLLREFFVIASSAFFIYLGAKYTVEAIIKLSQILNIAPEVIALSAVALGTSLPELAVAVAAAKKGIPEITVGNVLGSNIFNALAVMGVSAVIGTLVIPQNLIEFSIPLMLAATIMFYFVFHYKEVSRWHGFIFIVFYVFFIAKLFEFV
ncbi:calcium/sodium antiporter [Peptococcaceae bacterium]|nr:calcium/sodium antiporter [Peptococcaceae bacterium]MCL0067465.1 calcium/sodium antiporter [Peptococcaceae bacterium]